MLAAQCRPRSRSSCAQLSHPRLRIFVVGSSESSGAGARSVPGESAENRELRKRVRLLEQGNEVLRRAAAYPSQADLPRKGSTRSWVMCRVLDLARQSYCRSLVDPVTDSEVTEAHRAKVLFDAHRDNPEYFGCGSRP